MTNKSPPSLTKTCAICGQQKPLAAFLQMSGEQGTLSYSNICATCRSEEAKLPETEEREGSARETDELKIDAKKKLKDEQDQKEIARLEEEEKLKERLKIEEEEELKINKVSRIADGERKHRDGFLNIKPIVIKEIKEEVIEQKSTANNPNVAPTDEATQLANQQIENITLQQREREAQLDFAVGPVDVAGPIDYSRVAGLRKTTASPLKLKTEQNKRDQQKSAENTLMEERARLEKERINKTTQFTNKTQEEKIREKKVNQQSFLEKNKLPPSQSSDNLFKSFKGWVGTTAAIVKAAESLENKKDHEDNTPNPLNDLLSRRGK